MIAHAVSSRLMSGRGRSGRAARCRLPLEVVADEADERVNLLLAEPVLEARHPVAAVLNLLYELLVGVLDGVLVVEVRDFQGRAVVELDRAARAVLLVAARACVLEGRARVGQLVRRARGRGRRFRCRRRRGRSRVRVGGRVGRRIAAGRGEREKCERDERKLDEFHALKELLYGTLNCYGEKLREYNLAAREFESRPV